MGGSGTCASAAKLRQVAVFELGPAWSGNSLNCTTYRQHGVFSRNGRQALCFLDGTGHLIVGQRDLGGGGMETVRVEVPQRTQDAHYSPSLVIDTRNRIHVAGGAHVSPPFYGRSEAGDLASFRLVEDPALLGEERTSYPSFLTAAGGALFLLYRRGHPGRSVWCCRGWDEARQAWSDESVPILSGAGTATMHSGPYINTPLREHAGRFGLFHVWRSGKLPHTGSHVRNIGMDFCEVDLLDRQAFTHRGLQLQMPVTPFVTERVVAIPWDADLSNQAGATRLPDGRPFGVASHAEPGGRSQVHIFWPDQGGRWHSHPITRFTSSRRLVGGGTLYLPHSRPACAALPDGSVLVVFRTAEAGNALVAKRLLPPLFLAETAEDHLLWPDDLGFYEPVLDIGLAEATGRICAYVQACGQTRDNQTMAERAAAPAFLVEWRLD
ncbi:BNR-4 repeat-containing protein [Sediminicoccus rosea]|uniref:BNR-4 repeat-containing protein n=1 Tax=Sediminicoccus rosea TaxID=1225128 RepID=A0ABZ0PHI1_9PROT|nr:BNR-4 repeat-containing protein [Sediminicoccus rosea]WPB84741.1 BNR-4 repeat-containing protein [Sediminicoccus rosea]